MVLRKVLERQISLIKPSEKETETLKEKTKEIVGLLEKGLGKRKIRADVFIGGSLAKGTIIKKEKYDIDVFIRFSQKYKDGELSVLAGKVLNSPEIKRKFKLVKIHGSRDYFQLSLSKQPKLKMFFEVIPVIKIKKAEEARNVTDLSVLHVNYIKNKIKKRKNLAEEIMLAKSFCYAQEIYGAESYIRGFSGYALELLVSYYGSLESFIKIIVNSDINQNNKLVIDPARFYRNKQDILLSLNEAKLQSPIIFVDPTFKQRNALAALSNETFFKFKEACKKFLANPSLKFFEKHRLDIEKLKKYAKGKKAEFFALRAETDRQGGDIAASKLLKFFNLFSDEIDKLFFVFEKEFVYKEKQYAEIYFVLKRKKERIVPGPPINSLENLTKFKKAHKNCFIKQGKAYAREKVILSARQFFELFKKRNRQRLREMGITGLKVTQKN